MFLDVFLARYKGFALQVNQHKHKHKLYCNGRLSDCLSDALVEVLFFCFSHAMSNAK